MEKTLTVIDGGGRGTTSGGGGDREVEDWRLQLTRNRQGDLNANAHNLALIFENDDALRGLFALDEFASRVVLSRDPPWRGCNQREFTELDGVELSAWLGVSVVFGGYQLSAKSSLVVEVVEAIARRHRFHPVREYLESVAWDGVERIPSLFSQHCGTDDDEYHQRVAVIFMLSAVARILRPGCKVDTMLVLEGAQGLGKTRVTQTLFGGDRWYVDAQRSPAERDFYQDLVGKWGVEIGEMTSFSKAEANKVKQTLSATADVYRPSYGRYSRTFPRQCVFVGTTNEMEWQRDHTGGRRFLPVTVLRVDVDAIKAVRDQLWAEAVARLNRGEDWWSMPARAEAEQDARFTEDAWAQVLLQWLSGLGHSESYSGLKLAYREILGEVTEVSISELMIRALGLERGRIDKPSQMRVAQILTRWGWKKHRTKKYGPQMWVWYAPPDWKPMRMPDASREVGDV